MNTSTLTTKGQITIPAEIRQALKLHAGDQLVFELVDEKIQIFKKINDISHAFAMYKVNKTVTLDDMEKAIEKGYSDDSN